MLYILRVEQIEFFHQNENTKRHLLNCFSSKKTNINNNAAIISPPTTLFFGLESYSFIQIHMPTLDQVVPIQSLIILNTVLTY